IENGHSIPRTVERTESLALPLERSRVRADLHLQHRQKGLRWFSTYTVLFDGSYTFRNASERDRVVTFALHLPAQQALYDDLTFTVDGRPIPRVNAHDTTRGSVMIPAGRSAALHVGYRSQGLDSWSYRLGGDVAEAR